MQGIRNTVGEVRPETARDGVVRGLIRDRGLAGNHSPITDAEINTAIQNAQLLSR